jgi:Sortase domain
MRKLLICILLLLLAFFAVAAYNYSNHVTQPGDLTSLSPPPSPWQPTQLRIPRIQVNAPVMSVGRTASGAMDAPVSHAIHSPYWTSVFWYAFGAAPGQAGNAVIAGHVNRVGGDPAIFWSLSSLAPGDDVFVSNIQGQELHFVVSRVVRYPANAPSTDDLNTIFGPTSEHHLNLITCSGAWTGSGYDQRLVVFTTEVQ